MMRRSTVLRLFQLGPAPEGRLRGNERVAFALGYVGGRKRRQRNHHSLERGAPPPTHTTRSSLRNPRARRRPKPAAFPVSFRPLSLTLGDRLRESRLLPSAGSLRHVGAVAREVLESGGDRHEHRGPSMRLEASRWAAYGGGSDLSLAQCEDPLQPRESKVKRGRVLVTSWCLTLALASLSVFTPSAGALVGHYLSYFNIPPDHGGSDHRIEKRLLAYINGATDGSEIRGNITTISKPAITDALIAAHKRGVAVYLVQDGEAVKCPCASPEGNRLEAYFRTRHKYCYQDLGEMGPSVSDLTSCVSSVSSTVPTTHHLKNWLFSETVVDHMRRTFSSWVTSYNLTKTSDGQFNDAFVVNDNAALYNAYARSFRSFYNQARSDDFYRVAGRGHHVTPSANTEVSYSPQKTGDYVAAALSRIDRSEPGCALKVANLSISGSRDAVVYELGRIRRLGCRVQVAVSAAHSGAVRQLRDRNVELHLSKTTTIHSKMMVYRGRYDGTSGRTMVWGGSHNLTIASLRVRDEVFVAISRLGIYKNYRDYFDRIWAFSDPVAAPSPAAGRIHLKWLAPHGAGLESTPG